MAGLKKITDNIKKANKAAKKQKYVAKVKKAKNIHGNIERRKAAKLVAKTNSVNTATAVEMNQADYEYLEHDEVVLDDDNDMVDRDTSAIEDYEIPETTDSL